jgi:hypothetical protein
MKNIAARSLIFILSRFCASVLLLPALIIAAPTAFADEKVVIGTFTTDSQENFDKKIKPVFEDMKNSCKNCEIINLTPYDDKGIYSEKGLIDKLKNPPAEVSFFYFDWNKKTTGDQDKALITLLGEKADQGKLIITPTGQAKEGEAGAPLSRTIMGQARDAVIIGEITDRDRMLPQSYFGPEILTALRPPKAYIGQGHAALFFAARLASAWERRKPTEWLAHFKTKKMKSRKLWLDADDLVGR